MHPPPDLLSGALESWVTALVKAVIPWFTIGGLLLKVFCSSCGSRRCVRWCCTFGFGVEWIRLLNWYCVTGRDADTLVIVLQGLVTLSLWSVHGGGPAAGKWLIASAIVQ